MLSTACSAQCSGWLKVHGIIKAVTHMGPAAGAVLVWCLELVVARRLMSAWKDVPCHDALSAPVPAKGLCKLVR